MKFLYLICQAQEYPESASTVHFACLTYQLQVIRDAIKMEGPLCFDLRDSVGRDFQQAINIQRILV